MYNNRNLQNKINRFYLLFTVLVKIVTEIKNITNELKFEYYYF